MTIEKPEKTGPNIFKIILQTFVGIVIFSTAATNLLVVYVLFFPDSFPKPIYLVYQLPGQMNGGTVQTGGGGTNLLSGLSLPQATAPQQAAAPEASTESNTNAEATGMTPGQGYMLDTGTKIVNLADAGGKKFIRVTATLEFAYDKAKVEAMGEEEKAAFMTEFTNDLNSKLPVVDDVIITLLSEKDYQSVYTSDGKEQLRQQIIEAINQRLPEYKVIYVYFKEFVMQ